jgi:hypothetical protein
MEWDTSFHGGDAASCTWTHGAGRWRMLVACGGGQPLGRSEIWRPA